MSNNKNKSYNIIKKKGLKKIMNDIPQIIFQTMTGILSVIGGLCCIYYMLCNDKSDLHIKGNAYLILDIDEIGDKLEYYIRRIQNDIANRYIYISKIILYSKDNNNNNNIDSDIHAVCRILAKEYNNIIFLGDCDDKADCDKSNIINIIYGVTD